MMEEEQSQMMAEKESLEHDIGALTKKVAD